MVAATELVQLAHTTALSHGLDPSLIKAMIEQESSWCPWAVRYEPGFLSRYLAPTYTAGKITATQAYTRSMSWGLLQIMGQVAIELGFPGQFLSELCDPAVGLEWGCRHFGNRMARADGDVHAALLAWNGGANAAYPGEVQNRLKNYS